MEEEQNTQPIENNNVPEKMSGMLTMRDGTKVDPFSSPTPGESLTKSPDEKFPWERAPRHSEVEPFMKSLLLQLIEKENYINLLGLFISKVPVEEITQVILYRAMSKGEINNDLMLLLIEPVMYLIIAIAEHAELEVVMYEGEDEELSEMPQDAKDLYMQESKKLNENKTNGIASSAVAPSLLAKVKELPTAEEAGVLDNQEESEEDLDE
tara:strand:- start:222 stop:851 length:630 start_codon:yes stop_codon:yes gene_type:complete